MLKSKPSKIRIPLGAAIYGTVTEEVTHGIRTIYVHGIGAVYSSIPVKRGSFEAVLPAISIVGPTAGKVFVAWDGEGYVTCRSLLEIQSDPDLTLIGSVGDELPAEVNPGTTIKASDARPIESIAAQIRHLQIECDVTAEEMAEALDVARRSIYRHLAGKANPRTKQVASYEQFFSSNLGRVVTLKRQRKRQSKRQL